jgi:hypothetical protein
MEVTKKKFYNVVARREDRPGAWYKLDEYTNHDSSVNSIRLVNHRGNDKFMAKPILCMVNNKKRVLV